ncbi:MAG TPA: helix-turn-helix domain-containing protein [Polyangia bacterium]
MLDLGAIVADAIAPLRAELAEMRRLIEARPAAQSPDDEITIAEAAQIRGCSVAAMRKQVQRGGVPSVKRGRKVRVRRGSL